jgi:hypothetical protein
MARSLRYFALALGVEIVDNLADTLFKGYKIPTAIALTTAIIGI